MTTCAKKRALGYVQSVIYRRYSVLSICCTHACTDESLQFHKAGRQQQVYHFDQDHETENRSGGRGENTPAPVQELGPNPEMLEQLVPVRKTSKREKRGSRGLRARR